MHARHRKTAYLLCALCSSSLLSRMLVDLALRFFVVSVLLLLTLPCLLTPVLSAMATLSRPGAVLTESITLA